MTPRLPVSEDEDFEVADYEMLSESSESFAEPSSDEDFVVEVRHGDIYRLHYDEDHQQEEEVVYDLNVLFDEDNVDSDDNSDDNDFNPLEFNNDMSDAEMVDVEEEAPIIVETTQTRTGKYLLEIHIDHNDLLIPPSDYGES